MLVSYGLPEAEECLSNYSMLYWNSFPAQSNATVLTCLHQINLWVEVHAGLFAFTASRKRAQTKPIGFILDLPLSKW